jgi:hypothetical protein
MGRLGSLTGCAREAYICVVRSIGLLRKLAGIDQIVLAERAGVGRQCLSLGEDGRIFWRRSTLKRIDDALCSLLMERLGDGFRDQLAGVLMRRLEAVLDAQQVGAALAALILGGARSALGEPVELVDEPPGDEDGDQEERAAGGA